ncbi:IclR family transcriptional regulator domain-containing protein [Nocardioides jensenii]|uniref:IclR family transcriptional regulator domain-containing protein n=1 Tax=Nocardioides jensenii TaxID=1843 RepID=UPI0008327F05|nr:IclR family transcriptional regulator C-terminal domain-containing protein [Nocardioides jensenii]
MNDSPEAGLDRDRIQSIERGFAVLLAFDEESPSPTATEVAERTGLSRPAVRRILLTLQHLGYVKVSGQRWMLTPRVLTIGQHFAATNSIIEVTQPHLLRLAERTGESASLAQLDGIDVIYIARVHARRVLSLNVDIGTRLPAHATAMGRVLAAFGGADEVDRIINEGGLPALTSRTVTDPINFRDILHQVRVDGFAIVDGELEEGFLSASAPVRDAKGAVIAAIAYSTSRARQTPEEVARDVLPILREIALDIGSDLAVLGDRPRVLALGARNTFS